MYSLRRWLYKPRRDDTSILAQFFYADEDLNYVAAELDSFDGRKDPERCTHLVNQLRQCQDRVLNICNQIMEEIIPEQRANRDFRVKFPDDVLQENLAGQLWFGAECLAAGSSIMNREVESASMRPLAKALTKTLDNVRNLLREQCLRNPNCFNDKIKEALRIFDRYFAEFELSYVSAMVPVKTMREYDIQQEVIVLFSETLQRALQIGLITQDMVDDYDPALMFTIPRIAIICGLLNFPDGPLNVDLNPNDMSEMFRPFQNLLRKIRELLWSLSSSELFALEKALCSLEEPGMFQNATEETVHEPFVLPDVDDYVQKVCTDYPSCKQFISDFCERNFLHLPNEEAAEGDPRFWIQNCDTGEELVALQESLSNALTKVIERSGTRDSGLHSDTCSNSSGSSSSHNVQDRACHSGIHKIECRREEMSRFDEISLSSCEDTEINNVVTSIVDELVISATMSVDVEHIYDSSLDTGIPTHSKSQVDSCGAVTKCCRRDNSNTDIASPNIHSDKTHHPDFYRLFHSYPNSPCNCVDNPTDLRPFCNGNAIYSSCSSCQSAASSSDWDSDCCSSDTSSYNSDCQDDEEIALAIQAAEIATRNKARGRFRSSEDLIHRLFVCIAGVADQLQTNHASDLRNILKYVFQMNCSEPLIPPSPPPEESHSQLIDNILLEEEHGPNIDRINVENAEEAIENICHSSAAEEPPPWIPDELAPECMSCHAPFTVVRRRHHCRNCGKVFCSKCSSNSVPLPRYGHLKPVRVCNRCFLFQVTSFLIDD